MQQAVHLESIGSLIFVKPPILYVRVGDTVTFYSDDDKTYEIVIPNREKFFVSADGATIEITVISPTGPTSPINNKPIGTQKVYSVTTAAGGITDSPPKIIIVGSST
jgi:hypothetical protein